MISFCSLNPSLPMYTHAHLSLSLSLARTHARTHTHALSLTHTARAQFDMNTNSDPRDRATVGIGGGSRQLSQPEHAHTSAWVLLPKWCKESVLKSPYSRGCSFFLENAKGGLHAVHDDMDMLPSSTLPLLGHTAIMKSQDSACPFDVWKLVWDHASIAVSLAGTTLAEQVKEVVVQEDRRTPRRYMLFVHPYAPDIAAVGAYEAHAKRSAPDAKSEATLFFEVDSAGVAKRSSAGGGLLHAVLPTKIKTGVAAHLHGSWLLSVDRQSLQSLTENAWNACCLRQYSELFVLVLGWIATAAAKADSRSRAAEIVQAGFGILPTDMVRATDSEEEERYQQQLVHDARVRQQQQQQQQQRRTSKGKQHRSGRGHYDTSSSSSGSGGSSRGLAQKPKLRLTWPAFETHLDMQAVEHALTTQKLAPVWERESTLAPPPTSASTSSGGSGGGAAAAAPSRSVLGFATIRDLLYIPAPLLKRLPPAFASKWIGKRLLATDALGDFANSVVWDSVR